MASDSGAVSDSGTKSSDKRMPIPAARFRKFEYHSTKQDKVADNEVPQLRITRRESGS